MEDYIPIGSAPSLSPEEMSFLLPSISMLSLSIYLVAISLQTPNFMSVHVSRTKTKEMYEVECLK